MRALIAALLLSGCAVPLKAPPCEQVEPGRCYETGTTYRCDASDGSFWDYYPDGAVSHWRWTNKDTLCFEVMCSEAAK